MTGGDSDAAAQHRRRLLRRRVMLDRQRQSLQERASQQQQQQQQQHQQEQVPAAARRQDSLKLHSSSRQDEDAPSPPQHRKNASTQTNALQLGLIALHPKAKKAKKQKNEQEESSSQPILKFPVTLGRKPLVQLWWKACDEASDKRTQQQQQQRHTCHSKSCHVVAQHASKWSNSMLDISKHGSIEAVRCDHYLQRRSIIMEDEDEDEQIVQVQKLKQGDCLRVGDVLSIGPPNPKPQPPAATTTTTTTTTTASASSSWMRFQVVPVPVHTTTTTTTSESMAETDENARPIIKQQRSRQQKRQQNQQTQKETMKMKLDSDDDDDSTVEKKSSNEKKVSPGRARRGAWTSSSSEGESEEEDEHTRAARRPLWIETSVKPRRKRRHQPLTSIPESSKSSSSSEASLQHKNNNSSNSSTTSPPPLETQKHHSPYHHGAMLLQPRPTPSIRFPSSLRVVSLNVSSFEPSVMAPATFAPKKHFREAILAEQPDIICLQEVPLQDTERVTTLIEGFECLGATKSHCQYATVFLKSEWVPFCTRITYLGGGNGNNDDYEQGGAPCTLVRMEFAHQQSLLIGSCHLAPFQQGAQRRLEQVHAIHQAVVYEGATASIIAGDFNMRLREDDAVEALWKDAWKETGARRSEKNTWDSRDNTPRGKPRGSGPHNAYHGLDAFPFACRFDRIYFTDASSSSSTSIINQNASESSSNKKLKTTSGTNPSSSSSKATSQNNSNHLNNQTSLEATDFHLFANKPLTNPFHYLSDHFGMVATFSLTQETEL